MVAIETIKKKGWRRFTILLSILLCMSFLLSGCTEEQLVEVLDIVLDVVTETTNESTTQPQEQEITQVSQSASTVNGTMTVHFIDVGQADATLFIQNGHVMLFDAATRNRGDDLVKYIKNLGIEYIDVLVLTHPHDDHMGGAAEVLNNIEVGTVYGPDIFDISYLDTYVWYESLVYTITIINEKINSETSIWHLPKNSNGEFVKFNIGDAIVEFYAPLEDEYSDMNDYSICAKVTYGEIDIMLTGDATSKVESDLIEEGYNLDVEIFQASHHGSDTGNSKEFLEAMSPECIVISCGMKNRHNHPVKSVVELYKKMNIPVYRTDESGDIILTTDGTSYSFNKAPGTYTSGAEYKEGGK